MNDTQLLFFSLIVLYILECAHWVPCTSVAFNTWGWRNFRIVVPNPVLGNQRGGLVFSFPLPPLGTIMISHFVPVCISPRAILAYAPHAFASGGSPIQSGRVVQLSDIRSLTVDAKKININEQYFLTCQTSRAAQQLTAFIKKLLDEEPDRREKLIISTLDAAVDIQGPMLRIDQFKKETLLLRVACNLFCVGMIVAVFLCGIFYSLAAFLLPLVAFAGIMLPVVCVLYYRAHARLYPARRKKRIVEVIRMACYPLAAIRALDSLSWHLLEDHHPLPIAFVVCSPNDFQAYAASMLRSLAYSRELTEDEGRIGSLTKMWWQETNLKVIRGFLVSKGLWPDVSMCVLRNIDDSAKSYCPLCLRGYAIQEGECADCPNVRLVPVQTTIVNSKEADSLQVNE